MKRKFVCLLVLCLMLSVLALPAYAEDYQGGSGWRVTFNGKSMDDNFSQQDINDSISNLQPGDSVTFTVSLSNTSGKKADWYMTNKVLRSLEDTQTVAAGGGYTYLLTYQSSTGKSKTLFSSDTIGGELPDKDLEGLHQATNALEEFFFLDELNGNESGTITLKVSLDGETQGNAYQDTLADLQMNFAVEQRGKTIVPTGDSRTIVPYVIACGVSGLVLLVLAVLSLRARRKDRKVTEE